MISADLFSPEVTDLLRIGASHFDVIFGKG